MKKENCYILFYLKEKENVLNEGYHIEGVYEEYQHAKDEIIHSVMFDGAKEEDFKIVKKIFNYRNKGV